MRPEQQARQKIDAQLFASGWIVQDYSKMDLSAGRGITLCQGTVEAKRDGYLPLPVEHTRIVAEVERLLSVVEEEEGAGSTNLQRALGLRQTSLQNAFTGEL